MNKIRRYVSILTLALVGTSCGVESGEYSLDTAVEEAEEEMTRRLNVRVIPEHPHASFPEEGITPERFARIIETKCREYDDCGLGGLSCEDCSVAPPLCVAHTLLHIVGQAGETTVIQPNESGIPAAGVLTVPVQDQPTNAALALEAYERAATALRNAGELLGTTCTELQLGAPHGSRTYDEYLATSYGEAFELATEAIDALQRATLAVSDEYYSTRYEVAEAARLALHSGTVSRERLAHVLVGGSALGMAGVEGGFCPVSRVSYEASRALDLLRLAAPSPERVFAELEINRFVVDVLLPRLRIVDPHTDLAGITDADEVYASLGLSRDAFVEAREYVRSEIRAFDRSWAHEASPLELPGNETTADHFDRFAATASPPQAPPGTYYAAVAGFEPSASQPDTRVPPYGGFRDRGVGVAPSYASLVDGYLAGARRILSRTGLQGARGILAGQLADADTLRPGRIDACVSVDRDGWGTLDLTVHTRAGVSYPYVVRGLAGLECATRGTVDGAPCDLASYLYPTDFDNDEYDEPGLAVTYFSTEAGRVPLRGTPPSTSVPDAVLGFVVTRRPGTNGGPGDYDEFGGFMVRATGRDERICAHFPVVPEARRRVADALAPSPEHCGQAAMSCAGVRYDQRLPLENELTSDGDGVESSWRHYLNLARQAGDTADQLGEELIRAGLEMDLRAEGAIDELQRLCGVSLNVTSMRATPRQTPLAGGRCQAGYRLEGGHCVLDPIALARSMAATDADAARLDACLGSGATHPWVAVGNVPMCLWQSGPDAYCGGATSARPCPYLATVNDPLHPENATCPDRRPPGVTGQIITAAPALGLFHQPDPTELGPSPTRPGASEYPCAALAAARASGTAAPNSFFFSPSYIGSIAQRVNWSAGVGDYSSVLWDNGTAFGTGSASRGPATSWPCSAPPTCAAQTTLASCAGLQGCTWNPSSSTCTGTYQYELCPDASQLTNDPTRLTGPLFCLHSACGAPTPDATAGRIRRAQVNDLLARAVLAARLMGGVSLAGMRVPYYPRARDTTLWLTNPPGWNQPSAITGWPAQYTYQRATTGMFRIDNDGGGSYDVYDINLPDIPGIAERINGPVDTVPAGASLPATLRSVEWSACPYDRLRERDFPEGMPACTEFFDDQEDFDDARPHSQQMDRNIPFLVRTLPEETDGYDPGTAVGRLWDEQIRGLLAGRRPIGFTLPAIRALFDGDEWTDLTHYWRRSGCGQLGGGNCDYGTDLHTAGRTEEEEERARRDQRDCFTNTADQSFLTNRTCDTIGCNQRYYQCRQDADGHGIDFESTFDANRAFIAPHGLSGQDFLNGLELLCVLDRQANPSSGFGCPEGPPEVNSVVDMYALEAFLRCKGARIREAAASAVLRDLPSRVVELIQRQGATGTYGDVSGEYGAATAELAAAYVELRDTEEAIGTTLDDMANQIDLVRNAIAQSGITSQIEDLQLASTVADRVTQCVVSVGNFVASTGGSGLFGEANPNAIAGSAIAMAATCVNTGVQIGLATAIHDLQLQGLALQNEAAFIQFDTQFNALNRALSQQSAAIQASMLRISAAHGRLTTLREQGRRAVARALFLDSDATQTQYAANTVMRRRYSTVLHRYHEAHRQAVRLAFIAKLALEQRLGMRLDSMTEDLLTVEAPARWQATLCSMPSIDYDRVRSIMTDANGDPIEAPEGYAGAYVGDYVRRLEQVFESYNFEYPFSDGTDTAVLSIRDDMHAIRGTCSAEVPNLLYHAGHLDVGPTSTRPGWATEYCATVTPPAGNPTPPPGCVTVTDTAERALSLGVVQWGAATTMRVEFGTPSTPTADTLADDITVNTRLAQWLDVGAGRYRVSWYGRSTPMAPEGTALAPRTAVRFVQVGASSELDRTPTTPEHIFSSTYGAAPGWTRYWYFVDVSSDSEVAVAVDPGYTTTAAYRVVDLAGLMLEDVSETVLGNPTSSVASSTGGTIFLGSLRGPPPFFDTLDERTRELPLCVDESGAIFRRDAWSYGCVTVCPDGYDGSCGASARERCFYQTSFGVSSDSLQQLVGANSAGFAAGNYNYRIESVGINLVGTGLRDCERVGGGFGGCYASGNLAYSILHDGPYPVRNARGENYSAPLFRGRIESARALAAERYLTNPLSSTDRALIEPYVRHEFRGRPLGGTFTLRIWDDEGLQFERLEDVQLLLTYRYWQHQR